MRVLSYMREHAAAWIAAIGSGYQPERHYMRGPGPACAAREARIHAIQIVPIDRRSLH